MIREVKEVIKEIEYISHELDGKTIKDVIEYFSQFPLDAKFDIDPYSLYDCAYIESKVYRMRPETKDEIQKRLDKDKRTILDQEAIRRSNYEKLKKEFGK